MRPSYSNRSRAFTLVEILIVVVILGILAAIVTPQFAAATEQSARTAVVDQVNKIRRALAVYYVRNNSQYPDITAGSGTWGELMTSGGGYMRQAPVNVWVGEANGREIIIRATPDAGFVDTYGWIYDPATGNLWAAGCDGDDVPFPKP
jgi:general secretion pathway protein G